MEVAFTFKQKLKRQILGRSFLIKVGLLLLLKRTKAKGNSTTVAMTFQRLQKKLSYAKPLVLLRQFLHRMHIATTAIAIFPIKNGAVALRRRERAAVAKSPPPLATFCSVFYFHHNEENRKKKRACPKRKPLRCDC